MLENLNLVVIITGIAFTCYALERRVAWVAHVSAVCLIVLLGLLLSQIGVVPTTSEIYDFLQGPLVLVGLVMMTVGLHLNDVSKVPIRMLIIFGIGALASLLGGLLAGYIGSKDLGVDAYKIAAQLTASYIGGGENAVAMQKLYDIRKDYFVAVFAVDNIVTSLWMAFTIWFANDIEKEVPIRENDASSFDGSSMSIVNILASLFVSTLVVTLSQAAATHIGGLHKILWMSIFALIAGHLPVVREYLKSSYILGASLFAGFFFSIGAMSDLREVMNLPISIIAMPFIVVGVHALILISTIKVLKISKISAMVASQSLIGGPATAVAVAQARKWQSGISIGIVLGVLGYAIANFFGALTFKILQYIQPFS